MQKKEDTARNISSCVTIDVIDLTKESYDRTKVGRRRRHMVNEDVTTTCSSENPPNLHKRRITIAISNNQMQSPTMSWSENMSNSNSLPAEEIVNLDETVCVEEDKEAYYTTESDEGEPIPLTCPICYISFSSKLKPITTRCGHVFCSLCLTKHLEKSKHCPTCNAKVTLKSCIRLFI